MWIPIIVSWLAVWASTFLFRGLSLPFYAAVGVALVSLYVHLQLKRRWAETIIATFGASTTAILLCYALDTTLVATYAGTGTRAIQLLVSGVLIVAFAVAARTAARKA